MRYLFPATNEASSCTKFVSVFTVAFLTAIVVITLFLLAPKKELLRNIMQQKQADIIALKYLQNLLLIYPSDTSLKLLLAEQNISHGDIQKAINLIEPYIKQSPTTEAEWQALWLYYQIIRTETYAEPEVSYARIKGLKKMRDLLNVLAKGQLPGEDLLQLAGDALSANEPKLAISIYKEIVGMKTVPAQPSETYEKAAKVALSYGEYTTCAKLYFLAQQQATTLNENRKYYIAGLKALQSGNLLDQIMDVAQEHIGRLKSDQATLLFLSKLALASNRTDIAETYMKRAIMLEHLTSETK
jgi:polysaccharide biosynthesis protein PelB